ncbi:MAG TPA: glutathione S-transferase N-terminal domain-containing protein [Candidatus Paceibacterota bacterium]
MILYMKSSCPFSAKVLIEASLLGIEFEERNVKDDKIAQELIEKGGQLQTPYLIDEERGVAMYESDAIIDYLHATFTDGP